MPQLSVCCNVAQGTLVTAFLPVSRVQAPYISPRTKTPLVINFLDPLSTPTTRSTTPCSPQRQRSLFLPKGKINEDDHADHTTGSLVSVVDQIGSILAAPTPLVDIPFGYPLALLTASALFPWTTSLLLNASFLTYLYLGRQLLLTGTDDSDDDDDEDDNDDEGALDFAVLVGAFVSAGLLSPDSFDGINTAGIFRALGIAGVALAAAIVVQSLPNLIPKRSEDRKIMDTWDKIFERDVLDKDKND